MRARIFGVLAVLVLLVTFYAYLTGWQIPSFDPQPRNITDLIAHRLRGSCVDRAGTVAVHGSYAFVGVGAELVIVDVSDPIRPTVVGHTGFPTKSWMIPILGPDVQDIATATDYVYVAVMDGLRVVDITDPRAPNVVGDYRAGRAHGEACSCVAVAGNFAYVGFAGYLDVIDISAPEDPRRLGSYSYEPHTHMSGVLADGDYAYVATIGKLIVVDVSNPAAPLEVSTYEPIGDYFGVSPDGDRHRLPTWMHGMTVTGKFAYVTTSHRHPNKEDLWVVDISEPRAPVEVGSYDVSPPSGWNVGTGVIVVGDHAYVFDALERRPIPSAPADGQVVSIGRPEAVCALWTSPIRRLTTKRNTRRSSTIARWTWRSMGNMPTSWMDTI